MSDNFRCAESVIRLTNFLFKRLMGEYYLEGDELCYSRQEKIKVNTPAKLCLFHYDKDESAGVGAEELEAGIIVKKIKEYVNNPKYTNSQGEMYTYKDIAVLTRSKTALKIYESVFNSNSIPTASDVGESFYGKKEILLCLCILNSIDNPERDIYLAGFMRSFVGGFTDDELVVIKHKNKKMSLYRALLKYAKEESAENGELCEKCRSFAEKLSEYRTMSRGKSAEKLLWKIYSEFDLLNVCSSENFSPNGQNARRNLLKLYEMARSFSKTSFHGIGAFIDYIDGSMENGDIKSERELGGECVSLMTIHSSKGLEFPICFVSDLARKFNKSDEMSRLVYSEKAGAAVILCDTEGVESVKSNSALMNIDTPFRRLISSEIDKESLDEEIRVLYVALTRAKDMLIMTGHFPKKPETALKEAALASYLEDYKNGTSFCTLLTNCLADTRAVLPLYRWGDGEFEAQNDELCGFLECEYLTCCEAVEIYSGIEEAVSCDKLSDADEIDDELLCNLKKASDFDYRFGYLSKVPAKLTVSRLKTGLLDIESEKTNTQDETEYFEPVPVFVSGAHTADAAQKGTAMHMFMQFCDFESCEKRGAESEAVRLLECGFIDSEQKDLLDISKLDKFFDSDFYRQIKRSTRIYREQRFNLEVDAFADSSEDFEKMLGKEILVQGVIDLFYENDDGSFIVVDFKTDRVFGEGAEDVLIRRHSQQLKYYCRAVEEMTKSKVARAYIYSFSLMKGIEVEV